MTCRLAPSGLACAALALFAVFSAAPAVAHACSCMPQTVQVAYDQSVAVFEGHVVEVGQLTGDAPGPQRRSVRFDVVSQWKGAEDETLTLTTAGDSAQCGVAFTVGQSYLVYAAAGENGGLEVSLCSRTQPMAQAQEDLTALGLGSTPVNPKAEAPVAPVGTKPEPPAKGGCAGCAIANTASAAGAIVPVVLALALCARRRRRG